VQGAQVQSSGAINVIDSASCLIPACMSAQQPYLASLAGTYGVAAITTTKPCTSGELLFGVAGDVTTADECMTVQGLASGTCDPKGASLPSFVSTGTTSSTAFVTWYQTPAVADFDPLAACASAPTAPLLIAAVDVSNPMAPAKGSAVELSTGSTSVRPAGMTVLQATGSRDEVVVAAPDQAAVSVWAFGAASTPSEAPSPVPVPGLAQARAAFVAAATDGSGRLAVVAELGCKPQTLALALGTLSGGFGPTTTVTTADQGHFAVQPTVSWVSATTSENASNFTQSFWSVSWIAGGGGTTSRVLSQRFDANGKAIGGLLDPAVPASAAMALSDGTLFAYEQPAGQAGSFLGVELGCE
jgi:hypothetical protein